MTPRAGSLAIAVALALSLPRPCPAAPGAEAPTPPTDSADAPEGSSGPDAPATRSTEAPPAPAELPPGARRALELLAIGRFSVAADTFDTLSKTDEPTTRLWAEHLARMSRRWADEGRRLTGPAGTPAGKATPLTPNRRTTGEIALLYIDGVLYGLGSGLYVAVLAEPDSAAGVILPFLAFSATTAGAIAWADSADAFDYGVPRSISAGLRLGLLEGALWTAWNQAQSRRADEWSVEASVSVVWGATTAGGLIGGLLGARLGTTPGAASLVSSAGLWSALLGGLVAYGATTELEAGEADDIFLLSSALSLNLGVGLGVWLAARAEPSSDRVLYLDLGGLSGGLLIGGLYLALADRAVDEPALTLTTALGIAGGLGTAWFLTRDMETDPFAPDSGMSASLSLLPSPDGMTLGLSGHW